MYLSTSSVSNGVYTPPQKPGETGRYKEDTVTEVTTEKKPTLAELKETLAAEEENLEVLLGVFSNRMERLNELTNSNYPLGNVIDLQA